MGGPTGEHTGTKSQPSEAGVIWRGGARERARNDQTGVPRRSGLCDDEMRGVRSTILYCVTNMLRIPLTRHGFNLPPSPTQGGGFWPIPFCRKPAVNALHPAGMSRTPSPTRWWHNFSAFVGGGVPDAPNRSTYFQKATCDCTVSPICHCEPVTEKGPRRNPAYAVSAGRGRATK